MSLVDRECFRSRDSDKVSSFVTLDDGVNVNDVVIDFDALTSSENETDRDVVSDRDFDNESSRENETDDDSEFVSV